MVTKFVRIDLKYYIFYTIVIKEIKSSTPGGCETKQEILEARQRLSGK